MKFSVVVPLYNKAPYLAATLASVRSQSCDDYEVIVVDDGSTDSGPELARSLGDTRVRVVAQRNAGVSAARNRGIAEALGEWVAFLDADDWWHPGYLAALLRAESAHPQAGMLATGYRNVMHEADARFEPWAAPERALECIDDLYARWHGNRLMFTSSIAVRAETLRAMQPCFAVGESLGEDLEAWLRLAEHTPVIYNPAPLVARLHVPNNLASPAALLHEPPFLQRLEVRTRQREVPGRLLRSAMHFVAESRIALARRNLAVGDRPNALRCLARAWAGILGRRWWVTIALLPMPSQVVKRFEIRRRKIHP